MLKIVTDDSDRDPLAMALDELVTEGARRMLVAALETKVADYIARHRHLVDERGHRVVVRNGKAKERTLVTAAGGLKIEAPRVHDRRQGHRFSSYILPKYARRSPKVADVLPVLYLRGLSTGDFAPALEEFFDTDVGLSASSITRLVATWDDEYNAFESRDLTESEFVRAGVSAPYRSAGECYAPGSPQGTMSALGFESRRAHSGSLEP
jgi:transposase-like protein